MQKIENGVAFPDIEDAAFSRLLIETANEGILVIDANDNITFCNDRLCEILGFLKEEIIGKKRIDFVYNEDRDFVYSKVFNRRRGIKESYECRFRARYKEFIWCQVSASPIYDEDKNFIGSFGMLSDITSNKQLKISYAESEKRFKLFTENSLDIISFSKDNGECIFISPACKRILGNKPEELIGKNLIRLIHPGDVEKVIQSYKIAYTKPINITISFRIKRNDGKYIWCETSSRIVHNDISGEVEIQSSTRDISERKQGEIQLSESLNSFRAVIESTNDIIWTVCAENFNLKTFNSAVRNFFMETYSIDLEEGMRIEQIFPANKVLRWYNFYTNALLNGPFTIEYEFEDGRGIVELTFHPVVSLGNAIDVLVFGKNITERIFAKKELEKSERKYRLLFENMTAGFGLFRVLFDSYNRAYNAVVVEANQAFQSIFSVTADEIIGKNIKNVSPYLKKNWLKSLSDVALNGYSATFVDFIPSLNKYLDVWIFRHDDYHAAILVSDITDRKSTEIELSNYQQHLEELIKERTKKLEEVNMLLQAENEKVKAAEEKVLSALVKERELNELKTRFISMTSHEFRTPLTAILSSADLLELYGRKWSDEKNIKHTNQIRRSVKYMTELLEDVLTIGRVESGKTSFLPENISLKNLCIEIFENSKLKAAESHLFCFDFRIEDKEYYLDEKLISQILTNVINNSIKYSPNGGNIKFTVDKNEEMIVFVISDEGIGIADEEIKNLSTPFYRGRNVSTIPGTGLGLAIVKNSVELHQGQLSIESEIDKGTIITINIPLK